MQSEYAGEIITTAALEAEVARARDRHRRRIDALSRISEEQEGLRTAIADGMARSSTVWDVVSAAFGPEEVGPHVRRILGQIPVVDRWFEGGTDVAELEDRLQAAQTRVVQIAHQIDQLVLDRASLTGEMRQLRARIATAEGDAQRAAEAVLTLEERWAEGLNAEGANDLEARILLVEGEMRSFQQMARRLESVVHLHHDFLRLNEQLERSLSTLHTAATEALDALDRELARVATETRARELAATMENDLGALRASVARVNRVATEGAVLLTENLDRLSDEVDLLAPSDPAAFAAEREVSTFLRDNTVEQAVRRARAQVALQEKMSDLLGDTDG